MIKTSAERSIARRMALAKMANAPGLARLGVAQLERDAAAQMNSAAGPVGTTRRLTPQQMQLLARLQQVKGKRITGYDSRSGFRYE